MPNWCYNHIEVTGEPKGIRKISLIIETLKNEGGNDRLFQSLIGLPKGTDMENYENQGWYGTNVDWFGTKWDVGVEFVQDVEEDRITFSGETAWSPPVQFCIQLAKQYKVDVEMYYEEPGSDFTGKTWVDSEGNHTEEDYTYSEGKYRFDGFDEWYESEFLNHQSEYLVDELQDENEPDFIGSIKENFPFLKDKEVEECADTLKSLVSELTGKEF